jgi:hypothetical protein
LAELLNFDVVITTYAILVGDCPMQKSTPMLNESYMTSAGILFQAKFRRIILDEVKLGFYKRHKLSRIVTQKLPWCVARLAKLLIIDFLYPEHQFRIMFLTYTHSFGSFAIRFTPIEQRLIEKLE